VLMLLHPVIIRAKAVIAKRLFLVLRSIVKSLCCGS
jgi:hypothetical protein